MITSPDFLEVISEEIEPKKLFSDFSFNFTVENPVGVTIFYGISLFIILFICWGEGSQFHMKKII